MTQQSDLTTIGHIFLTLGIFGYYTNNSYLGCIGLALALLCYARKLIADLILFLKGKRRTPKTEDDHYPPIQTVSPSDTSISN